MSGSIYNRHEMRRAGYTFRGTGNCRGCNAAIEWWRTNNGKNTPFNPIENDTAEAVPHWSTCPKASDFKGPEVRQREMKAAREKAAQDLLESTGARAVIATYDDGQVTLSWRNGIPAEDLKHEMITAANRLRHKVVMNGGRA